MRAVYCYGSTPNNGSFAMTNINRINRWFVVSLFIAAVLALSWTGTKQAAAKSPVYKGGGIAIDGTDPVSYFKQGKPVRGSKKFSHKWNGATWLFSSEENRAAFAAKPRAYAPQYGGYCAYAVSKGYTAPTVPHAWKIVGGKLYLNYSTGIQKRWEKNQSQRISSGNKNWPKVLK